MKVNLGPVWLTRNSSVSVLKDEPQVYLYDAVHYTQSVKYDFNKQMKRRCLPYSLQVCCHIICSYSQTKVSPEGGNFPVELSAAVLRMK